MGNIPWFELLQQGDLVPPSVAAEGNELEMAEEYLLNSRWGLVALVVFTAAAAFLVSRGKQSHVIDRFTRTGSMAEQ